MYCAECGNKLKKNDKFCGECGALVENSEVVEETKTSQSDKKPSTNPEKKPMSKQTKIIIGVIAAVVVGLFVAFQVLSKQYEPKKVAEDYLNAIIKNDSNYLYKFAGIEGDTTFVSKKAFKEVMDEENDSSDVKEFKVTKVEYEDDKKVAKVSFSYKLKDSSVEDTGSVRLEKTDKKNFFFFDDWKLEGDGFGSLVVKDLELTVPVNSEITYDGVKVDKKESSDYNDVYVLPQVFAKETIIKAKLTSGLELEKTSRVSSYNDSIIVKFSSDTISDKTKKEIEKEVKEDLETLYKGAIEGKSFDDIKDTLNIDNDELKYLTSDYNKFVTNLNDSSNKLKSIKFNNIVLSSIYDSSNTITIRINAKYDYTLETTGSGEEAETKTIDRDSTGYFTIAYKYEKGKFVVYEIKKLVEYFSIY